MSETNETAAQENANDPVDNTTNEVKTFTQEEVNQIVSERVARVKNTYADYAELKTQADAFEAYKQVEDSRLEEAKTTAVNEAKTEFAKEKANAAIAFAAKGIFADPSDALLNLKDRSAEFITENGEVDTEKVNTAVNELLDAKPHLGIGKSSPHLTDVGLGRAGGSKPPASNAQKFADFMNAQLGN